MDATVSYDVATGSAQPPVVPAAVAPTAPLTPRAPGAPLEAGDVNPLDRQAPAAVENDEADNAPAIEPGQPQPVPVMAVQPPEPATPAQAPVQQGQPEQPHDSALSVVAAAFERNNIVSSMYERLFGDPDSNAPAVPGYDALSDIHGYEEYASDFTRSDSPAQTRVKKDRIDAERSNDAMIQRNGWPAYAAAMGAGVLDPITLTMMLVPGAGELGVASRLGRIGVSAGVNVAMGEAQQAALVATQETGSYKGGIGVRVSANALLAGVLGSFGRAIPKEEFDRVVPQVADDLEGMNTVPLESTAGAAAVHETTLEQESIARGGAFIAKTVGQASPVTRIMVNSPEAESRRLAQRLVDVPYTLNKNKEGIATPNSVETRVQQQENGRNFQLIKLLDDQFADYKTGGGQLSRADFSSEIADAMNNGDKHEIPQVSKVAKTLRPLLDDDNRALAEAGVPMPEGGRVTGAQSYLPWVWDQHAVMTRQTELEDTLTKWFTENPKREPVEVKAAGQEPMTDFYHGSQFVFDKLDHNKVNTGEGNQSFTHGIYGSENPAVAESYAREINGQPVENPQLYKGRIKTAHLKEMLDLDRPLSEQPEIMKMLGVDPKAEVPLNGIDPRWSGQELHDALLNGKTNVGAPVGDKAAVADWLSSKGIRGARYLDNGSRGGVAANGSRNLVLYKNAEAELTHRNGELINPEAAPKTELGEPVHREPAEVKAAVRDTMDHIMGLTQGSADLGTGVKNPNILKARSLDLPWELRKGFMSTDIEHIMKSYNHSALPQIEMRREFGSTDLANEMQAVSDRYRIKIAAAGADDAAKAKLTNQLGNDLQNLTLLRDRVLNQVGPRGNQSLALVRTAQLLRTLNYTRMLGGQTLSAPPDIGRLVVRYGLGNTGLRLAQVLTRTGGGLIKADAQRMSTALDVLLHTRQNSLENIGSELSGSGKLLQFARNQSSFFTKVSGIAHWDAMMRELSSQLEQDAISRVVRKGTQSQFEMSKLAAHGIGAEDIPAIRAQWDQHGSNEWGLNRARTELWDDKGAASKVEQAVQRAASASAFFVGKGDMPGFASSELGKMMVQFKAFAISSVNRLVIPLAQGLAHGDIRAANGLASLLALGAFSYYAKELAAGRKPDLSNGPRLIAEAVQRSGVMAYLPDMYDPVAGMLHLPRFNKFSQVDPLETAGGPTAGTLATLIKMIGQADAGKMNAATLHKLRQLVPYNNLFYFNRVVNMLEGKTADAFHLRGATGKSVADYLNPANDQPERPGPTDHNHLLGLSEIPN